ncbi:hypothetical protein SAMN05216267_101670 [Actinacidiphila rubida]|uniref:Uncharacterized protein n=2 Tax=Actinacidiphila rubida TaxID=310780 RepID=A0A1H8LKQ4_9ACTN|nr:hypothetical protein [Actinacidiphila rubida]SEO05792.1 hypothetical protein SAMN05216267_101670 [Actinacidiphila rubida]
MKLTRGSGAPAPAMTKEQDGAAESVEPADADRADRDDAPAQAQADEAEGAARRSTESAAATESERSTASARSTETDRPVAARPAERAGESVPEAAGHEGGSPGRTDGPDTDVDADRGRSGPAASGARPATGSTVSTGGKDSAAGAGSTGTTGTTSSGTSRTLSGTTTSGIATSGTASSAAADIDRLSRRMDRAVHGFVDDPKRAVREADEVLDAAAGLFEQRREEMRQGLGDGGDTEALRLALTRYRDLTRQLISLTVAP